jgi:hypothetical protein
MSPSFELGLILWLAGMAGIAAILPVIPQLTKGKTRLPTAALIALSLAQSAVLLALAVWVGIAVAPVTALRSALVPHFIDHSAVDFAPVLISGAIGALLGGALLIGAAAYARRRLPAQAQAFEPPISARLLYGGITEELLSRWGVMSVLAWLVAQILQTPQTLPAAMWIAIVAAALLFAIGHLPAARTVFGRLTVVVTSYVLVGNTAFGVLAGYLFWRYGIESAIVAHGGAHAISALAGKSGNAWRP